MHHNESSSLSLRSTRNNYAKIRACVPCRVLLIFAAFVLCSAGNEGSKRATLQIIFVFLFRCLPGEPLTRDKMVRSLYFHYHEARHPRARSGVLRCRFPMVYFYRKASQASRQAGGIATVGRYYKAPCASRVVIHRIKCGRPHRGSRRSRLSLRRRNRGRTRGVFTRLIVPVEAAGKLLSLPSIAEK